MEEIWEISFKINDKLKKGILLKENNFYYTIKLKNGYNIMLKKENVKILEKKIIKKKIIFKNKTVKTYNKNNKETKILILHTGGTIASKVDYETGAVSSKFTPEELFNLFPEIFEIANIESKLIMNIASEDMRFGHYNLLLKEIEKEIEKYDGIIITHGTDTMHYTSSALHYAIENLNKPIILVGAQRSSDRPSSDGFLNLISAIKFIDYYKENSFNKGFVGICMHKNINDEECLILRGINVKKLHSSRRDAFKPINSEPIAIINYYRDRIVLSNNYKLNFKENSKKRIKITYYNENLKIGILKAHPNLSIEELEIYKNFDGLIIEGTGLGHLSITCYDDITKENKKIFEKIREISKKLPVIMTTQTVFGRINMNVYSPGRKLQEINVKGNLSNLNTETAFIKLAYELSKNNCN